MQKSGKEGYSIQSREGDMRLGNVRVGEKMCPERTGEKRKASAVQGGGIRW